jgi:hypothetical protein
LEIRRQTRENQAVSRNTPQRTAVRGFLLVRLVKKRTFVVRPLRREPGGCVVGRFGARALRSLSRFAHRRLPE